MTNENQERHMIRKIQRGLSSTDSSSSDAVEPSKLPNEVLKLGARIVRELGLESVDTLGRWMAHHLAEVMQEAESADGNDKALAYERAVDLILKLWSHRRNLPNGAYPLNDLKALMSVVERLSPEASPYKRLRLDESEKLLAKIFDGLCLVVLHGAIIISETRNLPSDLESVDHFLDEDERKFIEVVEGWLKYVETGIPKPPIVFLPEDGKEGLDSRQNEIAELQKLDPKSRSKRIFAKEIDELIEALSDLKSKLAKRGHTGESS